MAEVAGVTWKVEYGEISEKELFRVGYIGMEVPEAYIPIGQLQDLIAVLAGLPVETEVPVKGTNLQARKVLDGNFVDVVVEPRLDTGTPSQLFRFGLPELADLQYTLGLFAADLANAYPEDWDLSKLLPVAVLGPDGKLPDGYFDTEKLAQDVAADINPDDIGAIPLSEKSEPDGVASLDVAGKLEESQVPDRLSDSALDNKIGVARGTVVDTEYASLDAAFAALASGGTIEIRGQHIRTATLTVNKPCTIRFNGGSLTTTNPNLNVITIASGDVTIASPRMVGAGVSTTGTGRAIRAMGTVSTRLKNIVVTNPDIRQFSYCAIEARLCDDVLIDGGEIQFIGYAGVLCLSVTRGRVSNVNIHDITQPTGYVNSYGVSFTHWDASEPPSRDWSVYKNIIARVPWEGVDTHGGVNGVIDGNVITECGAGIAVVGGPGVSAAVASKDVHVINNQIDYVAPGGSRSAGIIFVGPSWTAPDPVGDLATGIIVGNTVARSGGDSSLNAGVIIYNTQGVLCAANKIIEPAVNGIVLRYNNVNITVVNNTVTDVWSSSLITSCMFIGGDNNSGLIGGNTLERGSLTAARVNENGVRFSSSAVPNSFTVTPNNMAAATSSKLTDTTGAVIRPAITGSRGGNAALASLLTQLDANYIIKNNTTA